MFRGVSSGKRLGSARLGSARTSVAPQSADLLAGLVQMEKTLIGEGATPDPGLISQISSLYTLQADQLNGGKIE